MKALYLLDIENLSTTLCACKAPISYSDISLYNTSPAYQLLDFTGSIYSIEILNRFDSKKDAEESDEETSQIIPVAFNGENVPEYNIIIPYGLVLFTYHIDPY
jgi:hypothetical protein